MSLRIKSRVGPLNALKYSVADYFYPTLYFTVTYIRNVLKYIIILYISNNILYNALKWSILNEEVDVNKVKHFIARRLRSPTYLRR